MLVVASGQKRAENETQSRRRDEAFNPLPSSWQSTFKVLNPSPYSQLKAPPIPSQPLVLPLIPSLPFDIPALALLRFWLCTPPLYVKPHEIDYIVVPLFVMSLSSMSPSFYLKR